MNKELEALKRLNEIESDDDYWYSCQFKEDEKIVKNGLERLEKQDLGINERGIRK